MEYKLAIGINSFLLYIIGFLTPFYPMLPKVLKLCSWLAYFIMSISLFRLNVTSIFLFVSFLIVKQVGAFMVNQSYVLEYLVDSLQYGIVLFIWFLALNNYKNMVLYKKTNCYLLGFIGGNFLNSLYGIFWKRAFTAGPLKRAIGFSGDPNFFAFYSLLAFLVVDLLYRYKIIKRPFFILLSGIFLLSIIESYSRSAIFVLIMIIIIKGLPKMFLFFKNRFRITNFVKVLLLLACILFLLLFFDVYVDIFKYFSLRIEAFKLRFIMGAYKNDRPEIWIQKMSTFFQGSPANILFGISISEKILEPVKVTVHNSFLKAILEGGFIFGGIFIILLFLVSIKYFDCVAIIQIGGAFLALSILDQPFVIVWLLTIINKKILYVKNKISNM